MGKRERQSTKHVVEVEQLLKMNLINLAASKKGSSNTKIFLSSAYFVPSTELSTLDITCFNIHNNCMTQVLLSPNNTLGK